MLYYYFIFVLFLPFAVYRYRICEIMLFTTMTLLVRLMLCCLRLFVCLSFHFLFCVFILVFNQLVFSSNKFAVNVVFHACMYVCVCVCVIAFVFVCPMIMCPLHGAWSIGVWIKASTTIWILWFAFRIVCWLKLLNFHFISGALMFTVHRIWIEKCYDFSSKFFFYFFCIRWQRARQKREPFAIQLSVVIFSNNFLWDISSFSPSAPIFVQSLFIMVRDAT